MANPTRSRLSYGGPIARPVGPRDSQIPPGGRPWLRENLEHSLPVILAGVLCLGIGVWLGVSQIHATGSRLPLWLLVAAIGVTLIGGGSVLTLIEEVEDVANSRRVPEGYVLVNQNEWVRLRSDQSARFQEGPRDAREYPFPARISGGSSSVTAGSETKPGPEVAPAVGIEPTPSPRAGTPTRSSTELIGNLASPSVPRASAIGGIRVPGPRSTNGQRQGTKEFETVLSLLERAEATVRSRMFDEPPRLVQDRCVGCGIPTTSYTEQVCVVCDKPLCDRCLDRTASAGHPQMCYFCHATLPT